MHGASGCSGVCLLAILYICFENIYFVCSCSSLVRNLGGDMMRVLKRWKGTTHQRVGTRMSCCGQRCGCIEPPTMWVTWIMRFKMGSHLVEPLGPSPSSAGMLNTLLFKPLPLWYVISNIFFQFIRATLDGLYYYHVRSIWMHQNIAQQLLSCSQILYFGYICNNKVIVGLYLTILDCRTMKYWNEQQSGNN